MLELSDDDNQNQQETISVSKIETKFIRINYLIAMY